MPVPIRTLKVRPNPWTEINSRGLPCGRVAFEQPAGGFDPRTVGTSITNVVKIQDAPKGVQLGQEIHTWDVDAVSEDVLVPNTPYYRRRIVRGELIAADRISYAAAAGSSAGFEEHGALIAKIKADAIAAFDAANGEGAFEQLAQLRAEDKARAEEIKKAAASDQEPKILKHKAPEAKAEASAKKGDS